MLPGCIVDCWAGVIVRPIANYEMPDYLRVSIGLQSENEKFCHAGAGVRSSVIIVMSRDVAKNKSVWW